MFEEIPPATLVLCRTEAATDEKWAKPRSRAAIVHAGSGAGELSRRGCGACSSRAAEPSSWFLQAGCLDQLQICIAPVIIGSGRPSLDLPAIATMAEALRPMTRTLAMGDDVLFVCDLQRSPIGPGAVERGYLTSWGFIGGSE